MGFDINDFRSFTSILVTVTFLSILLWTLSPRRSKSFKEAAMNPLDDDDEIHGSISRATDAKEKHS